MFIKKDLRKIPQIIDHAKQQQDESKDAASPLTDLRLSKRKAEFSGTVKVLCQPDNLPALQHLQSLSLYDCGIHNLEGIGMLTTLENLSVGRNPLEDLPDGLSQLSQLKSLWLDDCRLQGPLPDSILQLRTLEQLRLGNNRISELPDGIGTQLPSLKVLTLDNNCLTHLPDTISQLECLETLQLRQNQLTELPYNFSLPSLRILHLSSNKLTHLPDSLVTCGSLTHLYLNKNCLTKLVDEMPCLSNLEHVNLSHNRIDALPTDFVHLFGRPDATTGQCTGKQGCVVLLLENPVIAIREESDNESNDAMQVDEEETTKDNAAAVGAPMQAEIAA